MNETTLTQEELQTLKDLSKTLTQYHKSGVIDSSMEFLAVLAVLKNAMTSESIVRTAQSLNKLMVMADQLVSGVGGSKRLEDMVHAASTAAHAAKHDKSSVKLIDIIKLVRDPQIQKGTKFLIHFFEQLNRQDRRKMH